MSGQSTLLFKLLLTLFRSNDDVYELISALDYAQIEMLKAGLPGTNSTRIAFTLPAAEQLKSHAQDGQALFDLLVSRFPARKQLIDTVRRSYLCLDAAAPAATAERPVDAAGPAPGAAALATQEKIMGDRPTFLDVAYLQRGAEMARSVAKLRMRFGQVWFTGTAFLIAPGRLMTAHHNLYDEDGQRADEVTAQFDYVRALTGLAAEGSTVTCKLETARGEAADDWAVIDLSWPMDGRKVMRFAQSPARVNDQVAIIQHPAGMAMQVALHNNLVTFADATRLQYLTDTLPGSSGAPVFDFNWDVVALHHAGGDLALPGTKQIVYRNQGIPAAQLRARMSALKAVSN